MRKFFSHLAEIPLVYFEARNFLRHRSHKLALKLTAEALLRRLPSHATAEARLAEKIINNATFDDHFRVRT